MGLLIYICFLYIIQSIKRFQKRTQKRHTDLDKHDGLYINFLSLLQLQPP